MKNCDNNQECLSKSFSIQFLSISPNSILFIKSKQTMTEKMIFYSLQINDISRSTSKEDSQKPWINLMLI